MTKASVARRINTPEHWPTIYPARYVSALMFASQTSDLQRINEITDEMARLGIVRPRTDASLFGSLRVEQMGGAQ